MPASSTASDGLSVLRPAPRQSSKQHLATSLVVVLVVKRAPMCDAARMPRCCIHGDFLQLNTNVWTSQKWSRSQTRFLCNEFAMPVLFVGELLAPLETRTRQSDWLAHFKNKHPASEMILCQRSFRCFRRCRNASQRSSRPYPNITDTQILAAARTSEKCVPCAVVGILKASDLYEVYSKSNIKLLSC